MQVLTLARLERRSMVCDRPQLTASVWTLLKSINARFLIPYRPHVQTLPEIMDSGRMLSTTVDGVVRHDVNACEGVSENTTLILDCWHSAAFWHCIVSYSIISYRIAIFCAVSYRIHRFPPQPYRSITILYHWKRTFCCGVYIRKRGWSFDITEKRKKERKKAYTRSI